jgi:hypothetical protein
MTGKKKWEKLTDLMKNNPDSKPIEITLSSSMTITNSTLLDKKPSPLDPMLSWIWKMKNSTKSTWDSEN